ncbi:MAG: 4-hydroxy-tetrahydrodipicolinate reductase [Rhodospirillales bacterium]|nr:4-hydroxy-tetrahydrodipicolinate reductase [Alphaproteobacteria bacterium]USO03627.1 MAG: 4-hydroxy-tetrahydrodipicolinate reductase [Rhodospirillales bacterium]
MKTGITGYKGRMGQMLVQEIEAQDGLSYFGGTEEGDDPAALFEEADCVIDFTVPDATRKHIWLAAKNHTPLIIGTTGLTEKDEKEMADAAKETVIVHAANMSVGVNMILALVEQAAARLGPEWDIEISETHHKHKIDAPSGTALALGKAAQAGRGSGNFVTDRSGKRNAGDIGFAVQRGSDVVGEHTLTFFGAGERVEIGHKATDRSIFAKGALRAALWTKDRPNGLYTMRDVLDL